MNEQIEMYRAVQDWRGEWRRFDPCYHEEHGFGTVDTVRDDEILVEFNKSKGTFFSFGINNPDLLWLPPTASRWPGDDERNLWDMVDWDKWSTNTWEDGRVTMVDDRLNMITDTLPEALLRAIASQERK